MSAIPPAELEHIKLKEKEFHNALHSRLRLIRYYSDRALLEHAIHYIPIEELKIKATLFLSTQEEECGIDLEDCMLPELLHWFKNSFFTWMDVPKCNNCNLVTKAKYKTHFQPSDMEFKKWDARSEEVFSCPKCQKVYRFTRYNHPKKLLETREGRCGEWANCFTLLCISLGYDARLVLDWTDHVWTEVYSKSRKKWIHCDPCEDICDKPLMYESGWNKKLSYVIAFSPKEVQDVTWRYTAHFQDVLKRRTQCREEFLLECILKIQEMLAEPLSPEEQRELISRRVNELAEFLTPPNPDSQSYVGRISGSLTWRLARGEASLSAQNFYVFKLCPEEIEQKHFGVKYSCASDKYIRRGESLQIEGWSSCAFTHFNVFRKVESDWKMVYLACTEGSSDGTITWKFNFRDSNLVINRIKLNLCSETFDSGKVRWIVFPQDREREPAVYSSNDVCPLETDKFRGCTGLLLTAELTPGKSWQHAQIFRQSLDSQVFPFEIEISFLERMDVTMG